MTAITNVLLLITIVLLGIGLFLTSLLYLMICAMSFVVGQLAGAVVSGIQLTAKFIRNHNE